ncbi:MAG: hypothetical protein D6775_08330, partial [Caldilineae bacterium]
MFANRSFLRPREFGELAREEAECLARYVEKEEGEQVVSRGRALCQKGLGPEVLLRLEQTAREYLIDTVGDVWLKPLLKRVGCYYDLLLQGFITAREYTILREQEQIRSAVQRSLERFTLQIEAAAAVGQAAISLLDLEELLATSIQLIRSRFD